MIPIHQNNRGSTWGKLFALIPLFIVIGCVFDDKVTGTVDETDTGIVAKLYNPDYTPAKGAKVKIFEVSDTTKIPASEVTTDENGDYSLGKIAEGIYNVYAEKGELVAFQDSISVLDDTVIIEDDTLETPTNLSGVVGLQPNHDPASVTVQVLGTDIYSNVNEDGYFTLNRMAKGDFTLKLSTTLDNYTTTYKNLTVDTNTPDTLSDTLWLIYTGIPVVGGLSATYDTLNGVVTLSWNATKYRNFQDYLIYRDYFDSLNMSLTPIAFTGDTVFYDTIFHQNSATGPLSFSDTTGYHFKYRVTIRNNSQEEGLSYKYIEALAASPTQVKTAFHHIAYHAEKGIETDSASINDPVTLIIRSENQTRMLSEIKYTDLDKDSVLYSKIIDSTKTNSDTLVVQWADIGRKMIETTVEDAAQNISKDTIEIFIVEDLPEIVIDTNDISMNVPFVLKGTDRFGDVTTITLDSNRYVQYEKRTDSTIEVTVSDTITDKLELKYHIQDDDKNIVDGILELSVGLKWEKISDNFLDSNFIRAAVEFNGDLFGFATSLHAPGRRDITYENYLYRSSDGENWSKALDTVPWSNWTSKPVIFNNRIYLIETISDSTDTNKIWYSDDGVSWESEVMRNFPKWYAWDKIRKSGYNSRSEIMFVNHKGRLWAGRAYYHILDNYDSFTFVFRSSTDGINWENVDENKTPQIGPSDDLQYILVDEKVIYCWSLSAATGWAISITDDFITHNTLYSFGSDYGMPVPVYFQKKILICSGESYGKNIKVMDMEGNASDYTMKYPGSLVHSCVVFNNKLFSISNNGVYSAK